MTATLPQLSKKAFTIPEVCMVSGLGRSSVYSAMATGKLQAFKHGRRTVIPADSVDSWIASLPRATFVKSKDNV